MTVHDSTDRNDYIGNGSVDTYSYTFKIFQDSDLLIETTDTNNNVTTLTLDVDYTVTGAGDEAGGSITLTAGSLATNYKLLIRRDLAITQTADIKNQGDFNPSIHENFFDKITMIAQRLDDEVGRSIKLPDNETEGLSVEVPLKTDRAGKYLSFGVDGGVEVNSLPSSLTTNAFLRADTIGALQALTGMSDNDHAIVKNYSISSTGGFGVYWYDAASAATADGYFVVQPSTGGGRWIRLQHWVGPGNVLAYGVDHTGTNDSTTEFQNAIDAISDYDEVHVPPWATVRIDGTLTVGYRKRIRVDGTIKRVTAATGTDPVFLFDDYEGIVYGSGIIYTEKSSPKGLVCFGCIDPSVDSQNSMRHCRIDGLTLKGVMAAGNICLAFNNNQAWGTSKAMYECMASNLVVTDFAVGIYASGDANEHSAINIKFRNLYSNGIYLDGTYSLSGTTDCTDWIIAFIDCSAGAATFDSIIKMKRGRNNIAVGIGGEPGGTAASSKVFDLDANSIYNKIDGYDKCSAASTFADNRNNIILSGSNGVYMHTMDFAGDTITLDTSVTTPLIDSDDVQIRKSLPTLNDEVSCSFNNSEGAGYKIAEIVGIRGSSNNSGTLGFKTMTAGTLATRMVLGSANLAPNATNNMDLGTSALAWKQIYAINHKSGVITLSAGSGTVAFNTAMPDANYSVVLTGDASEMFYLDSASPPTAAGFTVKSSNGSSTATVRWSVEPYNDL